MRSIKGREFSIDAPIFVGPERGLDLLKGSGASCLEQISNHASPEGIPGAPFTV